MLEVVSARPGDGKTTVAANLAVTLSEAGHSVALVDADLRAPRLHRIFATDPAMGLSNNLTGESVDTTIQQITEHLSVIPAGPLPPNPSELLSSKRMRAVIAELRIRFEYVVLDSAPLLPVSDGLAVAQQVDGVIVVAHSGHTSASPLNQALNSLSQVSAHVVGIVLNRVDAAHRRQRRLRLRRRVRQEGRDARPPGTVDVRQDMIWRRQPHTTRPGAAAG